jgi:hypothetical protein
MVWSGLSGPDHTVLSDPSGARRIHMVSAMAWAHTSQAKLDLGKKDGQPRSGEVKAQSQPVLLSWSQNMGISYFRFLLSRAHYITKYANSTIVQDLGNLLSNKLSVRYFNRNEILFNYSFKKIMFTNIYKLSHEPAPEPKLHQNRTGAKTNTVSSFGSSRLELAIGTSPN